MHFCEPASVCSPSCNQGFPVWFWHRPPTAACNSSSSLDLAEERSPRWDACGLHAVDPVPAEPALVPHFHRKAPWRRGSRPQLRLHLPSYLLLRKMTQKQQTSRLHRSGFPSAEPNRLMWGKPFCHWLVEDFHQNPTSISHHHSTEAPSGHIIFFFLVCAI